MSELLDERQLAAAEACVRVVLAENTTALGVEELRTSAGISRRTFHRWFPSKARWIVPVYAEVTTRFMADLRQGGAEPTVDGIARSWKAQVLGPTPERSLGLYRLLRADPEYWSVFLEVLDQNERTIAEAVRELSPGMDVVASQVAGVAIVGASRLALEAATSTGADAATEFARYLEAFSHASGRARG